VGLLANVNGISRPYTIEADALGTPRTVIDPTRGSLGTVVWRWELTGEAFGSDKPNEDPDGDGTAFVLDMRFPGQQYDSASGFNYNYFRDYDASIGRYVQSDPIGLAGGVSTYGYVVGNPFRWIDLFGLAAEINWYPEHDVDLHQGSDQYDSPPGTFTIAAHGVIGTLEIKNKEGQRITARQLWQQIQERVRRGKYKRIRLISCGTGAQVFNGRSFASDLALESGLPVEAPVEYIGFKNGELVMGPPIPNRNPPMLRIDPNAGFARFSRSCPTFNHQCF
jgi:RHS repeat-associated protein